MSTVIRRCVKRAGLIDRARTFRLEHNEKGLYILYLGPATGQFRTRRVSLLEEYMQKAALEHFGTKYEAVHVQAEAELQRVGLDAFAAQKQSGFIPSGARPEITLDESDCSVLIKHEKIKRKLFLDPADFKPMAAIRAAFQ